MKCANHPEVDSVAYCGLCGRALCADCKRDVHGMLYCETCLATRLQTPLFGPQAGPSPGVGLALGFIPGVGAIYNGQYAKGLVHAIIFGLLVSITSSGTAGDLEPLFGILIGVWVVYMALEAYHTARKRRAGEPVDEFSSILDVHGRRSGFPVGAITLIALGVLLLLSTTDVIQLHRLLPYWPVLLILAGAYMLYVRVEGGGEDSVRREVRHERQ